VNLPHQEICQWFLVLSMTTTDLGLR